MELLLFIYMFLFTSALHSSSSAFPPQSERRQKAGGTSAGQPSESGYLPANHISPVRVRRQLWLDDWERAERRRDDISRYPRGLAQKQVRPKQSIMWQYYNFLTFNLQDAAWIHKKTHKYLCCSLCLCTYNKLWINSSWILSSENVLWKI